MQAQTSEVSGQTTGPELYAQLAASQPAQNRAAGDPTQHLAGFLQQQGAVPPGVNMADPAAQAQIFHILSQLGPGAWGGSLGQPGANSQTLETILAHFSRHPELAASLPSLISSISGQQPPQLKTDGSTAAPLEAGPGTYTAQLYGGAAPGLTSDGGDKLDGSGDLGASGADADPTVSKANSVKCAKEKNRQAQRRFRERQKGLIHALKERAESLQKQVEDQRRQIETLEKENQVLKVILQEKQKT